MASRYLAAAAVLIVGAVVAPAWPQTPIAEPAVRTDTCGDPLPPFAVARIGTTRWGQHAVGKLTYSRDGKALAAGWHHDGAFTWDADTGKRLARLPFDQASRDIIAVSRDFRIVAVASSEPSIIRLLEVGSGKEHGVILTVTEPVSDLALSPDGKLLATTHYLNPAVVRLWDTARAARIWQFQGHSVAFHADGKTVLVGSTKRVRIFDLVTGKEIRRLEGAARRIALSADGKTLTTRGDTAIRIIDLPSGDERRTIATPDDAFDTRYDSLAISDDGRMVALGGRGFLSAWDTITGNACLRESGGPQVQSMAFRPGTQVLTWACDNSRIRHWNLAAGKEILPYPGHRDTLTPLGFTPDSKTLVSAGSDGIVQFLNLDNCKERLVQPPPVPEEKTAYPSRPYREVAYSSDGKWLAITEGRKQVSLIDAFTGKLVRTLNGATDCGRLVFSPDGKFLAGVRNHDARVFIWDTSTGRRVHAIDNGQHLYCVPVFSPDSKTLAVASDGIKLWDVATGKPVRRLLHDSPASVLAFAPDGQTLAAGWYAVAVLNVATREEIHTLGDQGCSRSLAISPDGKVIATSGDDRIVHLWDLATGSELARLYGHSDNVHGLVFSPNGKRLVSTSSDTTVLVWDVAAVLKAGRATIPKVVVSFDMGKLWADLAGVDAAAGHKAIWQLIDDPDRAFPWIQKHLKTTDYDDVKSPLVPARETLRSLRVIEILERIGTPAARKVIQALACADSPRLASAATAALARLDRKTGGHP